MGAAQGGVQYARNRGVAPEILHPGFLLTDRFAYLNQIMLWHIQSKVCYCENEFHSPFFVSHSDGGLNSYLFLLIYMVYENFSNSFGCINLFQNELPSPSPVWFCQFETEQLFETVMPFESYPLLKVSCISLCYCSLIKGLHSALWALLSVIDFVTVNANPTEEWKNAYYNLLVVIFFTCLRI